MEGQGGSLEGRVVGQSRLCAFGSSYLPAGIWKAKRLLDYLLAATYCMARSGAERSGEEIITMLLAID